MLRPTILIGIGSGGLRAIEFSWQLSQEIPDTTPVEEKPIIKYIYLETDKNNVAFSSEIRASSLVMQNTRASVKAVTDDISSTSAWLNGQQFPDNAISGAGGSPVFGRMCMWDIRNRENFKNELMNALHEITLLSLEKPLVYIVGSLGGGTGSGVFLDIAYIVRETFANQIELQGLFMIPNYGLADQVIYCNTVCALKEIEYYNSPKHKFSFKWQANPPIGFEAENTPYDLVQIISSEYNDVLGKIGYNQLQEDAGLFLYLNAVGLYDTRRKSLVDASGNVIITNYTTFGLSALRYPETEIKEIVANDLALSLFGNIVNLDFYFDSYNDKYSVKDTTMSVRNKVKSSFDNEFKQVLREWCDSIEVADSNLQIVALDMHLHTLAKMLASGNHSYIDKRMELYKYFRIGGEYYNQLKTRCEVNATDRVIKQIAKKIDESFAKYHNINLGIVALEAIKSSLLDVQNFWEANGLTSEPQKWDLYLKDKIVNAVLPMTLDFKILFEPENVYYDRLKFTLLYGLAMHIFSESLVKIMKGIDGKLDNMGNRIEVKATTGEILPSVVILKEKNDIIKLAISNTNPLSKSCSEVRTAIYNKLIRKNASNISYVYPEADLDATLKKVYGKFKGDHPNEASIKDITGNNDLYDFLFSIFTSDELYEKVVSKYKSMIDTGHFSVAEAVNESKNASFVKNIATKGTIPHVPVNPSSRDAIFKDHDKIPHVLLGYAGTQGNILVGIDQQLQSLGVFDFRVGNQERETLSYVGLNNWLVFYKEFGQMSDFKPFNVIDDLRDFRQFSSIYYDELKKTDSDSKLFHGKRMPYVSYDNCIVQANSYISLATKQFADKEYEFAMKNYGQAMYWDMSNSLPQGKMVELETILQKEDLMTKFDRYIIIADRYFGEQNFDIANYYYMRADKLTPDDPYVLGQRQHIDAIKTQIRTLTDGGDALCENAHSSYNDCARERDKLAVAGCITKYNAILDYYNKARALYATDSEIIKKIANIQRRINNLRNI